MWCWRSYLPCIKACTRIACTRYKWFRSLLLCSLKCVWRQRRAFKLFLFVDEELGLLSNRTKSIQTLFGTKTSSVQRQKLSTMLAYNNWKSKLKRDEKVVCQPESHTHTHTHARTHALTHTHAHTHTHTHFTILSFCQQCPQSSQLPFWCVTKRNDSVMIS